MKITYQKATLETNEHDEANETAFEEEMRGGNYRTSPRYALLENIITTVACSKCAEPISVPHRARRWRCKNCRVGRI